MIYHRYQLLCFSFLVIISTPALAMLTNLTPFQETLVGKPDTIIHNAMYKGYGGLNPFSCLHTPPQLTGPCKLTDGEIKLLEAAEKSTSVLREHKWDRPSFQTMTTVGSDNQTQFATSYNINYFDIFQKTVTWNKDQQAPILYNGFQYLWALGVFFPTRHLTSDARRFTTDTDFSMDYQKATNALAIYTEHTNYVYSVINYALSTHITDNIQTNSNLCDINTYIKQLRDAIYFQSKENPLPPATTVYRATRLSPLALLMLIQKKTFFIPSFTSTSLTREAAQKTQDGNKIIPSSDKKYNVEFIINLSEFSACATQIKPGQTAYHDEEEVLISCYTLFEYMKHELDETNNSVKVFLKTKDHRGYTPTKLVKVIKPDSTNCYRYKEPGVKEIWSYTYVKNADEAFDSWMGKRSVLARMNDMEGKYLFSNTVELFASFDRHFEIKEDSADSDSSITHQEKVVVTDESLKTQGISQENNPIKFVLMINNNQIVVPNVVLQDSEPLQKILEKNSLNNVVHFDISHPCDDDDVNALIEVFRAYEECVKETRRIYSKKGLPSPPAQHFNRLFKRDNISDKTLMNIIKIIKQIENIYLTQAYKNYINTKLQSNQKESNNPNTPWSVESIMNILYALPLNILKKIAELLNNFIANQSKQ